jgi:2-dehydro-3-deoxyglucarate aldolase/4-hydroxy-2-oxoheptanedioate aldolase
MAAMATLPEIRCKIADRELVVGSHVGLLDSSVSELLACVGFDFLWIDTEHSAIDRGVLLQHLVAAQAGGAAAFVRIPWNDPVLAKPVLEMGPAGLVFPWVCTAEQAKAAVAACLYPPAGVRGFGPRRAVRYGMVSAEQFVREAAGSFWRIMQIEHVEAVRNLEAIVAVEGVDAIVVGPNDLSGSLGLLGQTEHPEVQKLCDRIAEVARRAGVPFGTSIGDDPAIVRRWIERGVDWIATGTDIGSLVAGGRRALAQARELGALRGGQPPRAPGAPGAPGAREERLA